MHKGFKNIHKALENNNKGLEQKVAGKISKKYKGRKWTRIDQKSYSSLIEVSIINWIRFTQYGLLLCQRVI